LRIYIHILLVFYKKKNKTKWESRQTRKLFLSGNIEVIARVQWTRQEWRVAGETIWKIKTNCFLPQYFLQGRSVGGEVRRLRPLCRGAHVRLDPLILYSYNGNESLIHPHTKHCILAPRWIYPPLRPAQGCMASNSKQTEYVDRRIWGNPIINRTHYRFIMGPTLWIDPSQSSYLSWWIHVLSSSIRRSFTLLRRARSQIKSWPFGSLFVSAFYLIIKEKIIPK